MKKDFALIIGIDNYKELDPLGPGPSNDAKSFRDWLISKDGGDVPKKNCHMITSLPDFTPIQVQIDEELVDIYQKAKDARRFYFFFAGHGIGTSWNENGLCLPKWSRMLRNYALSSSSYLKVIVESGVFEEVFFFLDCCRNRVVSSYPMRPILNWPKPSQNTANVSSLVAYASSFDTPAKQAALPVHNNTLEIRGIFTSALIQGLKGAASEDNGNLTISGLKSYLDHRVKELTQNKQVVRFENTFTQNLVLQRMAPGKLKVDLEISFKTPGEIELYGPDMGLIEKKHSKEWPKSMAVSKGYHLVKNLTSEEEKFLIVELKFENNVQIPSKHEF